MGSSRQALLTTVNSRDMKAVYILISCFLVAAKSSSHGLGCMERRCMSSGTGFNNSPKNVTIATGGLRVSPSPELCACMCTWTRGCKGFHWATDTRYCHLYTSMVGKIGNGHAISGALNRCWENLSYGQIPIDV